MNAGVTLYRTKISTGMAHNPSPSHSHPLSHSEKESNGHQARPILADNMHEENNTPYEPIISLDFFLAELVRLSHIHTRGEALGRRKLLQQEASDRLHRKIS